MRQYCPARAEEDEQGNVHVDESEDVMEEEEENLDEIMGEVNKRSIDNILPRVTFLVYEFSSTTTATRISSNVDYQFCHYHSLIAISIHLATRHQK